MHQLGKATISPLLTKVNGLKHGFTNLGMTKEEITALDARTATAKQVHKADLLWVERFEKRNREADALATLIPGLSVGVFSADCTPLLVTAVSAPTNKVYAVMAVHAGWRGTALGIAGKSFREFSSALLDRRGPAIRFLAAIGPCISRESFEVGEDVIAAFPDAEALGLARFHRLEDGKRKYLFDLPGENLRQLKEAGQNLDLEIDMLGLCTVKLDGVFPSFRREREKAKRILSFLEFTE